MASQGELEDLRQQVRVGEAGGLPQLWIHADAGEPGNRVHLVRNHPVSRGNEEVDAGITFAAHHLVHANCELLDFLSHAFGYRRGNVELGCRLSGVLAVVVVKVAVRHYFADDACLGMLVTEHGAFNFASDDRLFDDRFVVVSESGLHGAVEVFARARASHANR
jgi:hypothetical protein